ncbi:4-hydroxythreonine-4-phosphate dehydrogenase PdxA [Marinicellulosiphila megalodicopiae]|uniref:4-hydroxythreonine-4-phosphate dehydrogenase PdxA n=1 Tax=Marinicellulosiphila megalodicopiae TaxID=2724896 RepID=UPI003BB1CB1D
MTNSTKRLVITSGEPAGIGPDIILKAAKNNHMASWIVLGDQSVFIARAELLKIKIHIELWMPGDPTPAHKAGVLLLYHVPVKNEVIPGKLDSENSEYVLELLKIATDGCVDNTFDAMVTAPVHKGVICESGVPFSGHTEFLEERTGADKVVMMLACTKLKVALVTTHLPLKDVAAAITPELLSEILATLIQSLKQQFGLKNPTILVAGLNPHAGESGHMGMEEIEVIEPTLKTFKTQANIIGPLPADTLFTPPYLEKADAVLAMYHDQGLPVLKCIGFGESVNITLGLPIIRTSVDHGTALDLAGTGQAKERSLICAIKWALQMSQKANYA